MILKIKNKIKNDIPVRDLKLGQLAVITKWYGRYEGYIVFLQANFNSDDPVKTRLVAVDSNIYWDDIKELSSDHTRVRVLEPGTELVIV